MIIGFVFLLIGAHFLVDGAVSLAKQMKISPIVIGLTIVAFGTSAPELVVNIVSSIQGNSDIAVGNILGSNIVNILFILGISAMIFPITAQRNTVLREIPFSLLAATLVAILGNDARIDGTGGSIISRIDGLVLISFFIIFLYYILGIAKPTDSSIQTEDIKTYSTQKSILLVALGCIMLALGGKWIVQGAVSLAEWFSVSESLIGLTIVAIGTSLPELATSTLAAYKRQSDIAIGNIVGSNIFNIFWILGISAVIHPLSLPISSDLDLAMTMGASLVLFLAMYIGKRHILERWQGAVMTMVYVVYIAFLIRIG
jgi:cation:H+ antiporter